MGFRFLFVGVFLWGKLYAQCTSSIHGHIFQKDTKISLSEVQVRIEPLGKILQTNSEGEFELLNVCEGEYQIFFRKRRFFAFANRFATQKR